MEASNNSTFMSVAMHLDDQPEGDDEQDTSRFSSMLDETKNRASVVKDTLDMLLSAYKATPSEQKRMTTVIASSIEHIVKQKGPEGTPARWCYVPYLPTDRVSGKCLSLDFGCSDHYFNVSVCQLIDKVSANLVQKSSTDSGDNGFEPIDAQAFLLTRSLRRASMDTFCDFVAVCLRKVIDDNNLTGTSSEPIFMGIVAGFDAKVKAQMTPTVASVSLTYKDYHMRGFIGSDFVAKFHAAFERANINVRIVTVLNDTVSTLISGVYQTIHMAHPDSDCSIGVVSNRCGANMSYLETDQEFLDQCSADQRLLLRSTRGSGHCAVVNTESGMWVGRKGELFDHGNLIERHLSEAMEEPIRFECIASGFWFYEQFRRCIHVLKNTGALGNNVPDCQQLSVSTCFAIFSHCDIWCDRRNAGLDVLASDLKSLLGAQIFTETDAGVVAEICQAIIGRTAQVLACGIMALALKIYGKFFPSEMIVAYSGSMFSFSMIVPTIVACLKSMVPSETEVSLLKTDVAFGCAGCAIAAGKCLSRRSGLS